MSSSRGRLRHPASRGTGTSLCGGFTLLEVMLAFALLAVGLGLLVAIQGGGLRQIQTAARVSEASLHAQSLLDQVGVMERIEPGRTQGEFDHGRFRWQLLIEEVDPAIVLPVLAAEPVVPVEPVVLAPAPGQAPMLYRLALEVRWGVGAGEQRLRFVTLRARQPLLPAGRP